MAAIDKKTLAAAKSYTKESLEGGGAVVGKNVIISSIDPIDGGNRITFSYTLDNGTVKTSSLDVMNGKDGQPGAHGTPGADGTDGISITGVAKTNTDGLVDTYTISFSDGSAFDYEVKNGEQGIQGLRGEQGEPGIPGQQGIQGIPGERGKDGYPFLIYKEYDSLSDFNSDDFPQIGLMFMVKEYDENNAYPVYRYTGEGENPYSYITGLSGGEAVKGDKGDPGQDGAQGIPGQAGQDGTTYQPTIGTVTAGNTASASVVTDDENKTAEFSFVLPKGDMGDKGDPGQNGTDGKSAYEIAVDNGFIGSEGDWLESLDGEDGKDGKDGRSITAITTDDANNVIVTFSDGTTQIIGQLNVDVQADFLTSGGFGNLRYYNGKFQYYDTATETWVDAEATQDNPLVVNMMPNPMRHIVGFYDNELGHYKLRWLEPEDTVVDNQVICLVEKVVIRRKLGSAPQNENDGELVKVVERSEFGSRYNNWYVDSNFTPELGEAYCYKAFPVSTTGFANASTSNETGGILAKDYEIYGFIYDTTESNPDKMLSTIEDNSKFRSMHMNYDADMFDYGDWDTSYIIKKLKTCVLGFDGNVLYDLDKNNANLKTDGTPSNIENETVTGNAMSGIAKTYIDFKSLGDGKYAYRFSNKKVDNTFKCYAHHDSNGDEIPYIYEPMFPGSLDSSGRLRSLSDKTPIANKTRQQEINAAQLNNIGGAHIWYTEVTADRQLINLLLLLMGMSGNTKEVYGKGNNNSYVSESNTGIKKTGLMNQKGAFFGYNDNVSGVKVFGIEHYWGNQWRALGGWISDHGTQKIKMTYGTEDGSTIDGYNLGGSGYITIPNSTPSGTSGGYISSVIATENGIIPKNANGSASTYLCDGLWFDNSKVNYALAGGGAASELPVGAFCSTLYVDASFTAWSTCAALSCKPLATGGES